MAATGSKSAYIVLDNDIQYAINDIVAITKYNALISPVSSLYSSHEPVACIVDGMEYNVKQNTYKVKMHVPNQDDDITNTLQVKTTIIWRFKYLLRYLSTNYMYENN